MNTRATKRRIGVLGGMGPEATVLLMARVVAMTSVDDDSDHVSMIVDNNTQIPSRIKALIEKTGDDPGPILADMARGLETYGAEALAMPCNTAHHYAPVIEKAVDIPLLNMVQLAVSHLEALDLTIRSVGILASPAVQTTQIFDHAFNSRNIKTLYPSDQDQMLDSIRTVKSNSSDGTARQIMEKAARELIDSEADCLLVACSELSIIADALPTVIPCLDTIDILAQSIIEFAGARLRNNDSRVALELKRA